MDTIAMCNFLHQMRLIIGGWMWEQPRGGSAEYVKHMLAHNDGIFWQPYGSWPGVEDGYYFGPGSINYCNEEY